MDAHALLTSQGWRGTGHSLHPTSDLTGLSKPILVSQKRNTLGVGKKQHKTSDMWWMNAFDSSLKGLDTSKEGVVVQTITSGGLDMVARGGGKYVGKGGLYACFVRGEMLGGTLTPEIMEENVEVESSAESSARDSKKRKREDKQDKKAKKLALQSQIEPKPSTSKVAEGPTGSLTVSEEENEEETKEQRRARKAAKKAARTEAVSVEATESSEESQQETKEQRRERRRLKKLTKGQEKTSDLENTSGLITNNDIPSDVNEAKEERRERKRLKKLALETPTESAEASDAGISKKKKKEKKR